MSTDAAIDWEDTYCAFLPESLRPPAGDPRFINAAAAVRDAGWSPMQAAAIVSGRGSYEGVRNPASIAVMRLEDLARRGPDQAPAHRRTCSVGCAFGWFDNPDGTTTTPCPECRPRLAAKVATIPAPGRRSEQDYAYLRDKG
jgi:hypothetical protein